MPGTLRGARAPWSKSGFLVEQKMAKVAYVIVPESREAIKTGPGAV